jgi:hypothetical protein
MSRCEIVAVTVHAGVTVALARVAGEDLFVLARVSAPVAPGMTTAFELDDALVVTATQQD